MAKVLLFNHTEEVEASLHPNKVTKIKVDNREICMVRNKKELFAFEKQCPHQSDDLSRGNINPDNEVVCAWHAYRFSLKTGEEAERRCADLKVYPVSIEDDQVFIEI